MDPEESTTGTIFDTIPDTYGGGTAVLERPPVKEAPKEPEKREAADPAADLLAAKPKVEGEEKKPVEKTPAQFAKERREAKEQRRELLDKAPKLEEENRTLKEQFEQSQKRLAELEAMTSKERDEAAVTEDDIETWKTRAEAAEKRYIAANSPQFSPYEDEEVRRHAAAIDDALRTNLPRFAMDAHGKNIRLDLNLLRKDPARKGAMDTAVKDYALASEAGDATGMDRAIVVLGTALGNLDLEDDAVKIALDSALSAASDPFYKGIARFKEVQTNAATIVQQRRAQQIRETEAKLLAPFRLDPKMVDEALEADPSHPWGNFGALLRDMPEEFRAMAEIEVQRDAAVLGAMTFNPPPLAPGATTEDIAKHEAIVRAGSARAVEAARYLAVGRVMLDGGVLAHLRAQAAEAKARLEEVGETLSIPNRGGAVTKKDEKGAGGIWDEVPSTYGGR
jgi:hypothetical protein